jgi:hypothetical protein
MGKANRTLLLDLVIENNHGQQKPFFYLVPSLNFQAVD